MTGAARSRRTVRDHFVTIAEAPAGLLQAVQARLPRLQALLSPQRADARFLMELGEDLFQIAFADDQVYTDFIQALAETVAVDGTLRLWLHVKDAGLAMLPWEYLCLTNEAVEHCRQLGMNLAKQQPDQTLPEEATFLALHPHVSLVRQTNPALPEPGILRIGALRVLVFVAQMVEEDRQRVHFFYRDTAGVVDPDDWVLQVWLSLTGRHGMLVENPPSDPLDSPCTSPLPKAPWSMPTSTAIPPCYHSSSHAFRPPTSTCCAAGAWIAASTRSAIATAIPSATARPRSTEPTTRSLPVW